MDHLGLPRQAGGQVSNLRYPTSCLNTSMATAGLANHQSLSDHHNEFEVQEHAMNPIPASEVNRMSKQETFATPKDDAARPAPNTQSVKATTQAAFSVAQGSRRQTYINGQLDNAAWEREHTFISESEQDALYFDLLRRCHSFARLQAQGYRLTVEPSEKKSRRQKRSEKKSGEEAFTAEDRGKALNQAQGDRNKPTNKKSSKDTSKWSKSEQIYFKHTPRSVPGQAYGTRRAVALDCEMVGVIGGSDEVAFLSAVDFFTGEVLIHAYVQPTKKVIQWRTSVSGITPAGMSAAVMAGKALKGWRSAQQELWKHAGINTILVGHGLNNDLNVLRIIHPKIVDSAILSAEAVFSGPSARLRRIWSLKTVAEIFLHRAIQMGGKTGHDCLEDAYATRDVVIWCLQNPDSLTSWALNARAEYELKMEQMRREHEAREREKKKAKQAEEAAKKESESKTTGPDADLSLEDAIQQPADQALDMAMALDEQDWDLINASSREGSDDTSGAAQCPIN